MPIPAPEVPVETSKTKAADVAFETLRLHVTPWRAMLSGSARLDLEAAVAAMLTPAVLAPLPPAVQDLSRGVSGWIDRQARLAEGHTIDAAGEIIGLLLLVRPAPGEIHVGYLLAEPVWGRGYASEMLRGLVGHLRPDAPLLKAGVAKDNPASARVLVKAGFAPRADTPGSDIWHFERQL